MSRYAEGDYVAAESYLKEALELRRELLGAGHPSVAISLLGLGQVLIRQGRPEKAETLLREGLAIREQKLPQDHWRSANARSILGGCLTALRRYPEAEPLLLDGLGSLRARWGDRHQVTLEALARVINLYQAWAKPKQAEHYRSLAPHRDD